MESVRVAAPGMVTTIQDRGRWGWQNLGVSVSGAMDLRSHRLANMLIGNDTDAATLEVTLVGPDVEFEDDRVAVVTGAEFDLVIGDRAIQTGVPFAARAGSVLRFGRRRRGARAYLAIAGGIDVPLVFGSRSTHLPSGIGGFDGRALRAADRLHLGKTVRQPV